MENNFKLKFDGQLHQIDANVLVSSLIHTTSIIQEANKYLDTGKKIEIKIKALEKGSFMVNIELVESALESLKSLFTKDNIEYASAIITILGGVISVKKFLKGRDVKSQKPTGNNRTTITNVDGDVLIVENSVINIYQSSPIVREALSQSFEALENDGSVEGFEIMDHNEKPIVRVDRNDFEYMSVLSEEINADEKIVTEAATVYILRLSFEDSLKWDLYFKGNKISAKIKDPNFYELIDKGEPFAKGDILEVELQTTKKFDVSVNTFVNKSYQINKIIRHIRRDEQPTFNFSNE